MIIDDRLEFSDAGAWNTLGTSATVWDQLGDVIDLGVVNRMPSQGKTPYLVITIVTANDGGGGAAGTVQFRLCSDASEPPATDGTPTVHYMSDIYTAGQLAANSIMVVPLPVGFPNYERYLAFQALFGTEEEDDLVGNAFITFDPSYWVSLADASNSNP